jgi:cysteine desulfurase
MDIFRNLFGKKRIFMDYAGGEANPSGIHKEGMEAKKRLEDARARIANILKCQTRDIIFTSGGTESDNLAILGVFEAARDKFERPHIIIGENEHPAVYESAMEAKRRGAELTITADPLKHIKENTVLVSMMYADNETGAINNVPKITRLIREYRQKKGSEHPYMHTDATSAYEYLEVDIDKVPADLVSLDRVLVVRPRVSIRPLLYGGAQEMGLRSGTQDVRAAEELASSLKKLVGDREREAARLRGIKEVFIDEAKKISGLVVNTPKESLPNIVSVSFPGKLHEFLAVKLDLEGVAVSTGSSCDSSKNEPDKEALRFSFGAKTSENDAREAVRKLRKIVIE